MVNIDRIEEMRSIAKPGALPEVWTVLHALQEAAAQLEANVNTRLVMEGLGLKLPRWHLVRASEDSAHSTITSADNR